MSFTNLDGQINIQKVGAGEIQANGGNVILSTTDFENTATATKVLAGRFASVTAAGKLVKGAGNGTLAGVVVRETTNSLEVNPDGSFDAASNIISFLRSGLITVDASTNEVAPAQFTKVKVKDSDGTATTATTNSSDTNAEFIEEIKPQVWLIRLV